MNRKFLTQLTALSEITEKNKKIFCWLFLFNIQIAVYVYYRFGEEQIEKDICFFLACLCLLSLIVTSFLFTYFLSKFSKRLQYYVLAVTALLFIGDSYTLVLYKCLFDSVIIRTIMDTNIQEALEYFFTQFHFAYLLYISGIISLYFIYRVFCGLVTWICGRKYFFGLIAMICTVSFIIYVGFTSIFTPLSLSVLRIGYYLPQSIYDVYTYENIYHSLQHETKLITNQSDLPTVVFVLGESTSRTHMSIYGYELPTTPNMNKRQADGELLCFTDVISPQTQTMPVVERLFTFYNNETPGKWYQYQNVFDILNAAGYRTVWLSNQETTGIYGNIPRAYAERCTEHEFTTVGGSLVHINELDENILPILDKHLKEPAEKNFYILHLLGTHETYHQRYPETYSRFTAAEESGSKQAQKEVRAEYDNAVLYADHILNQIIQRFEKEDAIVIYVSDHGEDVYDDGENRGHYPHGSLHQLEIPMLIWMSDKFKIAHPEYQEKISRAVHRPYMTDDMIYSLLDLLKITTPEFDSTRSIFSADFNADRKRVYDGKDYDTDR